MESENTHKEDILKHTESTNGIPNYFLTTVEIFRKAFPNGIEYESNDYYAILAFLDSEEFSPNSMASFIDFCFNIDYYKVIYHSMSTKALNLMEEVSRIEDLLKSFDIEEWRKSIN